ncbi:MAG: DNA polymerase III subunit alpha, partial [Brevinematia bacterium]
AAIRDVGRVLGIPLTRVDTIAKAMNNIETISEAKSLISEIREIYENKDPIEKEWIETSEKLEGIVRHASIHASGIVISSVPIHEYIALYKDPKEGTISTQIPAQHLEELGFLKMDVLGLSNLSVIQDTVSLIKKTKGIEIDISSIPLDDTKTYALLSSGRTDGVFQVESDGMKELLKSMKPSNIQDIIAALALYRPGPLGSGMDKQYINRKHGLEKVEYPHPDLEDILQETYGVILYQEQIMKIAQKICNFTLGQADNLRRAIGKKKKEIMDQMRNLFVEGAVKNGYDEKFSQELFETIAKFAEYGFNKSHSAAYAIITYQTAYLKANYPEEYMTALINSEIGKFDKMIKYIQEAQRMNINILPPDINKSSKFFSIEEGPSIRYGFMGIKGLGESSVDELIKEREKNGIYTSIDDFFKRTRNFLKKNSYETLIKSGALDTLIQDRGRLLNSLEKIITTISYLSKENEIGQHNLFLTISDTTTEEKTKIETLISEEETINKNTILAYEKETIGIFLSSNPIKEYYNKIKYFTSFDIDYIEILPEGCPFTIMGIISEIEKKDTIRGKITTIKVTDIKGKETYLYLSVEATKEFDNILHVDKIMLFKGIISKATSGKVFPKVSKVIEIDNYKHEKITELHIIASNEIEDNSLTHLKKILKENPGNCLTYIGILNNGSIKYFKLASTYAIKPSTKLSSKLRNIQGIKSFWYF